MIRDTELCSNPDLLCQRYPFEIKVVDQYSHVNTTIKLMLTASVPSQNLRYHHYEVAQRTQLFRDVPALLSDMH